MKHPRLKVIISIGLLFVLITGLALGYAVFNEATSIVDSDEVTSMKLEGIKMTLVKQPEIYKEAAIVFGMQLSARVSLFALALRQIVREEGEAVLRHYENGLVLRRDDDGFVLPKEPGAVPSLEPVDYPDAPTALTPCNPFVETSATTGPASARARISNTCCAPTAASPGAITT